MPRIVLVTHTSSGGVGTLTRFLREAIRRSGHYSADVILLATSATDSCSVRLFSPATWFKEPRLTLTQADGCQHYHVGALWSEFEFQRYQPRRILTSLLKEYDLIQIVAGTPAWACVATQTERPIVLQVATLAVSERVSVLKTTRGPRSLWLWLMTLVTRQQDIRGLKAADVICVENMWMLDKAGSVRGRGNVVFAPPGVDTKLFYPAPVYRADGYICCVARLADPRKNIRLLLYAYHALRQRMASVPPLVLVGQHGVSPEDGALIGALGLQADVVVRRDIDAQKLPEVYREAALFVLSSDEEGLGIVILEAMASGLPVVSTDCGGPSTIVHPGETGLLTPVNDVHALTDALQSLLERPDLRKQMGQAARKSVEKRFSIDAAGKIYLGVYADLLGSKKAR